MVEKLSGEPWHLGFVVHDVEKTAKRLQGLLGIDTWITRVVEPQSATSHGEEVSHTFKIAMGHLGSLGIELLQPVKGKSVYAEHLDKGEESFHHIAVRIPENELREVLDQLKERGGEVIQTGIVGESSGYYYIDLKEINLFLELNPTEV